MLSHALSLTQEGGTAVTLPVLACSCLLARRQTAKGLGGLRGLRSACCSNTLRRLFAVDDSGVYCWLSFQD
jgi:hypothetical protein